jgi:hypothetical protein
MVRIFIIYIHYDRKSLKQLEHLDVHDYLIKRKLQCLSLNIDIVASFRPAFWPTIPRKSVKMS